MVVIAVPLGVLAHPARAAPAAPVVLAFANIGQAAPSLGLLALFFVLFVGASGRSC